MHGYVIQGTWRYLEHSWVAREGDYVFEPPGEEHTLTVDDDDEMRTFFFIDGPVLYVEDNLGLIRQCREHFARVGLGADFVDQLIR